MEAVSSEIFSVVNGMGRIVAGKSWSLSAGLKGNGRRDWGTFECRG